MIFIHAKPVSGPFALVCACFLDMFKASSAEVNRPSWCSVQGVDIPRREAESKPFRALDAMIVD